MSLTRRAQRFLYFESSRPSLVDRVASGQSANSYQVHKARFNPQMTTITSSLATLSPLQISPSPTRSIKLDSLLAIMPKRLLSAKPDPSKTSKERQKRAELRIKVVTQPVMEPIPRELPRSATRLLTLLYEALTQAKNCEVSGSSLLVRLVELIRNGRGQVSKDDFWRRFAPEPGKGTVGYTVAGLEHTLETVGLECNSHASTL